MNEKILSATLAYPALFEPEPKGGFTVTFPRQASRPSWDAVHT
jgi:hypothetical protein